ncbi:hypothetical protein N7476_010872 [Penicillium atrosanguineum]|uniref:Inositol-1-monophosphatase n=1 Tax=Penicillium atrosanguineum TaxID=1132637 RepID=A0A9W9U125_9EURO|nr:hypothetical protein N7476_010872 [Penicillium atrosanguineum]
MATPNLQEIHDFLVSLAFQAGDIITNALPGTSDTDSKLNSMEFGNFREQKLKLISPGADLVTEYDRAVENMISTSLKEKYPDYVFHGEETYNPAHPLTDAPTFIVDPIDGTVNFVHGFPCACVSLGFAVGRIPTVGVVYNPSTKNLYTAIRGQGAFLNRTTRLPLKGNNVEPLAGLANALIAIEWGSDRSGQNWETKIRTFEKLGQSKEKGGAMVRSMRSLGSAALNICAVAEGTLDLYWEGGCWEWDVCAGWVILAEAGGIMVDGSPGKEIVEEFWSYIQGKLEY